MHCLPQSVKLVVTMMKGSQKTLRLIFVGIAIAVALALGLGLGLGLKKDSSANAAEVVPTYKLASSVSLDGMTEAAFTDVPKLAFRKGMAYTLGVTVDDVSITSVETVTSRRMRSLLVAGLKVKFEVSIVPDDNDTSDDITAMVAAVTTKITTTPAATIAANLATAYLEVDTTVGASSPFTVTVQATTPTVKTVVVVNGVQTETTVCGTNERVSSKTCVACSSGQSNAAGDNPAGVDTLCDTGAPPPPPPSPPPSPPPPSPPPSNDCEGESSSGDSCGESGDSV